MTFETVETTPAAADVLDRTGHAIRTGIDTVVAPLGAEFLVDARVQMTDERLALTMAAVDVACRIDREIAATGPALGRRMDCMSGFMQWWKAGRLPARISATYHSAAA